MHTLTCSLTHSLTCSLNYLLKKVPAQTYILLYSLIHMFHSLTTNSHAGGSFIQTNIYSHVHKCPFLIHLHIHLFIGHIYSLTLFMHTHTNTHTNMNTHMNTHRNIHTHTYIQTKTHSLIC